MERWGGVGAGAQGLASQPQLGCRAVEVGGRAQGTHPLSALAVPAVKQTGTCPAYLPLRGELCTHPAIRVENHTSNGCASLCTGPHPFVDALTPKCLRMALYLETLPLRR